jgi:hypothetical protein
VVTVAPNNGAPKQITPQQQQQNCRSGAIVVGTGVATIAGATAVAVIAWEDVAAVFAESAIEGTMTGGHLLTSLFSAPAAAVGVGFNQMILNCGKP